MAIAYKFQFAPRFRRRAFGWKSTTPILRIKEAVNEIKAIAKKEPASAAEGAVLFLEKLAPAIEQVDSSSGGIGSAVNRAIETLVPIIVKAEVSHAVRQKWLERLWDAIQEDDMPYLEYLGEFWGELCTTPDIASYWADYTSPTLETMWNHCARTGEYGYYKGTTACCERRYKTASIWRRRLIVAILPRFGGPPFRGICTVDWSGQALRTAVITVPRTKPVGTQNVPP